MWPKTRYNNIMRKGAATTGKKQFDTAIKKRRKAAVRKANPKPRFQFVEMPMMPAKVKPSLVQRALKFLHLA